MVQSIRITCYLVISSLLFACCTASSESDLAQKRAKRKRWYSIALEREPGTLDPRFASSLEEITICSLLNEGLYRVGKDGRPEPGIAESSELSEDACTYTFHLRESFWSNGDPLTAGDFERTWRQNLTPKFPAAMGQLLYVITNAEAVKKGQLDPSQLAVEALDPKTLRVRLHHPCPYFTELLTQPAFFPVHASQQEGVEDLITNGPFVLTRWRTNYELALTRNYRYWDTAHIQLDSVYLRLVLSDPVTAQGMMDTKTMSWIGSPLSTLVDESIPSFLDKGLVKADPAAATEFIRANTTRPVLDNAKFRRALSYAIDRQPLVEHIIPGGHRVAERFVPPQLSTNAMLPSEDAKTMLKEALTELGYSDTKQLPVLELVYSDCPRRHKIAQFLQDSWRSKLGVTVKLQRLEPKVHLQRQKALDYDLSIGSWFADVPDASNFLEIFQSAACPSNRCGWEDAVYALTLERAARELDPAQRKHLLMKAENILLEQQPIIPLFHNALLHVDNEEVGGVVITDTGRLELRHAHWN
ncbi:MAG: peptide ABC transporter substrate-binding protein [Chlamydiia bacterium]|nr:peptide ABC transporter substrate-binding protein [Chlamydiia bacterium]